MNRTLRVILVLVVVVAALLEWKVFRFRTYFQGVDVQETLPTMPAGARSETIVEGSFVGVDTIHKGSGIARIVLQGGRRYLQLEDFRVTNGPDLFVYLSESKTPGSSLRSLDKYLDLGPLKGNSGNQVYEIPEPFRGYDTAVIWCREFGVLFSYAVMR